MAEVKYCTYVTFYEGRYYIGKSTTAKVASGYQGSGKKLRDVWKKYPSDLWETMVIHSFDTEQEAFDDEAQLVTYETLTDPLCLNFRPGGRGGFGDRGQPKPPRSAEHCQNLSKPRGPRKKPVSTETRSNISAALKGKSFGPRSEESCKKQGETAKARWHRSAVSIGKLRCAKQTPGAIKKGLASAWPRVSV
jgi:hypothetical protein